MSGYISRIWRKKWFGIRLVQTKAVTYIVYVTNLFYDGMYSIVLYILSYLS